ncbi:hypothetical protein QOT17_019032 [Balamuthia mandrillaris]
MKSGSRCIGSPAAWARGGAVLFSARRSAGAVGYARPLTAAMSGGASSLCSATASFAPASSPSFFASSSAFSSFPSLSTTARSTVTTHSVKTTTTTSIPKHANALSGHTGFSLLLENLPEEEDDGS